MHITSFPFCCTAKILVGFENSSTAENDWNNPAPKTKEGLEKYILKEIKYYKEKGKAFLCATTNNEQKDIHLVLLKLGFFHSTWMGKRQHNETKVRLWWYPLEEK